MNWSITLLILFRKNHYIIIPLSYTQTLCPSRAIHQSYYFTLLHLAITLKVKWGTPLWIASYKLQNFQQKLQIAKFEKIWSNLTMYLFKAILTIGSAGAKLELSP